VQAPNHFDRQRTLAVEDFGHFRAATEIGFEIFAAQPSALHEVSDGLDGIGPKHWIVLLFVDFVANTSSRSPSGVPGLAVVAFDIGCNAIVSDEARVPIG